MTRACVVAMIVWACGGCGNARHPEAPPGTLLEFDAAMLAPHDAGPARDAGPHDVGPYDAGPPRDTGPIGDAAPAAESATVTVSGARSASYHFVEPANYVDCIADGAGLLAIQAYQVPGSIADGFEFITTHWSGVPGTFPYTYVMFGSTNPTLDTSVLGLYKYGFSYDYSRVDFHNVYSVCTVSFTSTVHPRIHGTIHCTDLIARSISADYQSSPAVFEPRVNLDVTFDCNLAGPW